MAHFLEHLVFKGGEKYDDYRKVNETAERMGAVLNAYTSHDLVAFHITCRAEVVAEAIDLLTDFVGRPKIDAEELDRERGVVIQEIARANDQPSVVAEHLIDRAAFGDHPLGRPVLGPEEHLRTLHARRDRRLPPAPVGGRARRRVPGRQPRARARRRASWPSRSGASRRSRPNGALRAGAGVRARRRSSRSATPTSRTCASPTGPPIDPRDPRAARRADRSTRRCSAARWARACSTRSASSAGSPTRVYSVDHAFADVPILQLSAGPRVGQVRRGLHAHARDRRRAARRRPDARRSSSAPAPTPPAGACWRSRTRTRSRATPPTRPSSSAQDIDPDERDRRARRGHARARGRGRARHLGASRRWPASARTTVAEFE